MKRLISFLFAITVCVAVAKPAFALDFTIGEKLSHTLSVCAEKKDAIGIIDLHVNKSLEAAQDAFAANPKCGNAVVTFGNVGRVVHSAKVKVNGEDRTSSVVEILLEGEVIGYFLTTAPVLTSSKATGLDGMPLQLKRERDA